MSKGYTAMVHERNNRTVGSVSACEWDNEDFPVAWEIQFDCGTPLSTVVSTREFLSEFSGVEGLVAEENPHR